MVNEVLDEEICIKETEIGVVIFEKMGNQSSCEMILHWYPGPAIDSKLLQTRIA
jgi:hypothetical protein